MSQCFFYPHEIKSAVNDLERFVESLEQEPERQAMETLPYVHGSMREIRQCEPPPREQITGTTLAVSRATIAKAMRDYMAIEDPAHMLLIPAPPGTGKTFAGVDFAHWATTEIEKRVMYAGPRHDFFMDILAASSEQNRDTSDWYEWLPRQNDEQNDLAHTCNYADPINKWLGRGYKGMDFCSQICGWDYINKGCPYHAQKKRTQPLIYAQHAHVVLGHAMATQFGVVIGDESPLTTFVYDFHIPKKFVMPTGIDPTTGLGAVLNDMQQLAERGARLQGPDLMKQLDARRVVDACESFTMPIGADVISPHLRTEYDVDDVGYNFLPELVQPLLMEAMAAVAGVPYVERITLSETGLNIDTRREVNPHMPNHIIWFDATGKPGLYSELFKREVDVVDVNPQLTGRIYQVVNRANGKGSLIDREGEPQERIGQLSTQIDAISSQYDNPALITFQQLESLFDIKSTHFYGSRGTNEFQDCDCLIIAGTPQPPLFQIEKTARSIWNTRMRPFDADWYTQVRRYNYIDDDNHGWEYPISQYGDPELNEILYQMRDAEIIQSAHRARILFRDVPVYLLTNIPIDELPPTKLLTIRELLGAPDGVDVFKWFDVLAFAKDRDYLDARELVEEFGIDKKTALKYLDVLTGVGWEDGEAIRRVGSRGPKPKAIRRAATAETVE